MHQVAVMANNLLCHGSHFILHCKEGAAIPAALIIRLHISVAE